MLWLSIWENYIHYRPSGHNDLHTKTMNLFVNWEALANINKGLQEPDLLRRCTYPTCFLLLRYTFVADSVTLSDVACHYAYSLLPLLICLLQQCHSWESKPQVSKHLYPKMPDSVIFITSSNPSVSKKKHFPFPEWAGNGIHHQAAFQLNLPWVVTDDEHDDFLGAPSMNSIYCYSWLPE